MNVVVDTSALLRLFIPDGPLPEGIEECVAAAEQSSIGLLAPELILAEAGQVLLKKISQTVLSPEEGREILRDLLAIPFQTFSHRFLVPRALELAQIHGTTVYDALFLSLAEDQAATLLTADTHLRQIAQDMRLPPWAGLPLT